MFEYDSRKLLIYFAVKYDGNITKILSALECREELDVPIEEVNKVCDNLKCKTMTILDQDYPLTLKMMNYPPIVLFYYGDISLIYEEQHRFGVVGSRDYSEYGEQATISIVSEMARGNVLVSGLARGIDTIAHQTAIDNHGRTVAVLGSGIDNCYPEENKELYEEIKKKHLVISEYPPMSAPDRDHFPMRNRLIVALSQALIVPQINSHVSGTIISVNLAQEKGIPIYVVPHPILDGTFNNDLIQEGSEIAQSGMQILEALNWDR